MAGIRMTNHGRQSMPLAGPSPARVSRRPRRLPSGRLPSVRSALTLVELLVVIGIMLILAAVSVPAMRPAMENRRIREAARMTNMYITRARYRAMQTGQICGVELVRAGQPEGCVQIRQVQVPPAFTGLSADAVVRVQRWNVASLFQVFRVLVRATDFPDGTIRQGDLIQFGVRGWQSGSLTYMVLDAGDAHIAQEFDRTADQFITFSSGSTTDRESTLGNSANTWITDRVMTVVLIDRTADTPWPERTTIACDPNPNPDDSLPPDFSNWSEAVPFCIQRQPTATEVQPIQLPDQTCIDMPESGSDTVGLDLVNPGTAGQMPVWILFSPSGALYDVLGAFHPSIGYSLISPTDRLYLLIGRTDRLPDDPTPPTIGANSVVTRPPREAPQTEELLADAAQVDVDPQNAVSNGQQKLRNWRDTRNLWVTINPQTGFVTTVENARVNTSSLTLSPASSFNYNLWDSTNLRWPHRNTALFQARRFAREAESMGGR